MDPHRAFMTIQNLKQTKESITLQVGEKHKFKGKNKILDIYLVGTNYAFKICNSESLDTYYISFDINRDFISKYGNPVLGCKKVNIKIIENFSDRIVFSFTDPMDIGFVEQSIPHSGTFHFDLVKYEIDDPGKLTKRAQYKSSSIELINDAAILFE